MLVQERAAQIWSVLALASLNRQVLTYPLPPLTILVVRSDSGMPGTGFSAASDIPRVQRQVFAYDWLKRGAPSPDLLAIAARERPSNGVTTTAPAT